MGKYSEGKDYKVIAFAVALFFNDERLDIIRAVAKECRKHNCKTIFYSTLTDFYYHDLTDAGEQKIFDAVEVDKLDAIVIMAESFKEDVEYLKMIGRAKEAGVPVISVDKALEGCINIRFDYKGAFRRIVTHMIEDHGYKKVNFIAGIKDNEFSDERIAVYREVLEKNGIPFDPGRVYYGDFWTDPTLEAMKQMEEDGFEDVDAIICANDMMAIVAGNYLVERGYRVPEDIAISGFDGIHLEKYCVPRLTTGIYNLQGFIETVFQIIDMQARGEDCKKDWVIYNKMQLGNSCGCNVLTSEHAAFEMIQLKQAYNSEVKYQSEMGQMVTNYGNAESLKEILQAIPDYIRDLHYKDYWYCMNLPEYQADGESYSSVMRVAHYHYSKTDGTKVEQISHMNRKELIPDREKYLDDSDYLMVSTMHMEGQTTGYSVANFNIDDFWFTGYATFLLNFRHLLEIHDTYHKMLDLYQKDPLTGLYNRIGFYHYVQDLMENAKDKEMSVIMMDMDYLKQVNDTYGHAEGDLALQALGSAIRNNINDELAARIGGDEFLIVLTGESTEKRAEDLKENILQDIAAYNQESNRGYELHASAGCYTERIGTNMLDYFMKKADEVMYAAKAVHHREKPFL